MSVVNKPMKKINKALKQTAGFSLIEILVFISILSFVFIAAAALGTVSIRNSQNATNKILATRYGEELMNWIRGQKEADWGAFVAKSSPTPYCFSQEPVSVWPAAGTCNTTQLINSLFEREATLTYDEVQQRVNVDIVIEWTESGNNFRVNLDSVFAPLEDL